MGGGEIVYFLKEKFNISHLHTANTGKKTALIMQICRAFEMMHMAYLLLNIKCPLIPHSLDFVCVKLNMIK